MKSNLVWCGIYVKYLAFGTYLTSAMGALRTKSYLFIFVERTNKGATESLQSQVQIVGNILNLRCFLNIYCYVIIRYWALAERERERNAINSLIADESLKSVPLCVAFLACFVSFYLIINLPIIPF